MSKKLVTILRDAAGLTADQAVLSGARDTTSMRTETLHINPVGGTCLEFNVPEEVAPRVPRGSRFESEMLSATPALLGDDRTGYIVLLPTQDGREEPFWFPTFSGSEADETGYLLSDFLTFRR